VRDSLGFSTPVCVSCERFSSLFHQVSSGKDDLLGKIPEWPRKNSHAKKQAQLSAEEEALLGLALKW